MNTNKTIKIGYQTFKMYQNAQTGWIFVKGGRSKSWLSVAKVADGKIEKIDHEEAIREATNSELANAWIAQ